MKIAFIFLTLCVGEYGAAGNICESREPIREDGVGRLVDPIRLCGSRTVKVATGLRIVVFVGSDQRTLCAADASTGLHLWSYLLLSSAKGDVLVEPSTLRLTPLHAFAIVTHSPSSSESRFGMIQHNLVNGTKEGSCVWFDGTCSDNASMSVRSLPWVRPDWRAHLGPGDQVDFFDKTRGHWTEASVVSSQPTSIVVSSPTPMKHAPEAGKCCDQEVALSAVEPHLSKSLAWGGAVGAGDYAEVYDRSTGGWQLLNVARRLEANDPRNGAGETILQVENDWVPLRSPSDESELAFPCAMPCGTHLAFSDMPRQMLVRGNRVFVLLTRLPGLSPMLNAYEYSDTGGEVSLTWSHTLQNCVNPVDVGGSDEGPSVLPELIAFDEEGWVNNADRNNKNSGDDDDAAALVLVACDGRHDRHLVAVKSLAGRSAWEFDLAPARQNESPSHGAIGETARKLGRGKSWVGLRRGAVVRSLQTRRPLSVAATAIESGEVILWLEDQRALVVVKSDGSTEPLLVANRTSPTGAECLRTEDSSSGGSGKGLFKHARPCAWVDVPRRTQFGPTCGLHALSMVLHFWRLHSPHRCHHHTATPTTSTPPALGEEEASVCATPCVGDESLGSPLASHLLLGRTHKEAAPAPRGSLLDLARSRGYSALGEMFNATMLASVAVAVGGYKATVHHEATLSDVRRLLEAGRPVLAPFDVDSSGEPRRGGQGESAHYAVLVGLVEYGNSRTIDEEKKGDDCDAESGKGMYLLARHSWNMREVHVWPWHRFCESWRGLVGTSFYGDPGEGVTAEFSEGVLTESQKMGDRGVIPASLYTQGVSGLKRPGRVKLKRVASGGSSTAASISESLSGALIEVIPSSLDLFGTSQVWDEGPVT